MSRRYYFFFIIILTIAVNSPALSAQERQSPNSFCDTSVQFSILDSSTKKIVGTIATRTPERYALIKDISEDNKGLYLYGQGDYVSDDCKILSLKDGHILLVLPADKRITLMPKMLYKDIEFVKSVLLDTFEYRYKTVKQKKRRDDEKFKVIEIKGRKAFLERVYSEPPALKFGTKQTKKDAGEEETADEMFVKSVLTKKMGNDVWIVDGKSVSASVVNDVGKVFRDATKSINSVGIGKGGVKLRISARVCDGVLDSDGFSVASLSPDLREKAGFAEGDIIKAINGQRIANALDLFFTFLQIKRNKLSVVEVELLRNGQLRKLTYVIR